MVKKFTFYFVLFLYLEKSDYYLFLLPFPIYTRLSIGDTNNLSQHSNTKCKPKYHKCVAAKNTYLGAKTAHKNKW